MRVAWLRGMATAVRMLPLGDMASIRVAPLPLVVLPPCPAGIM
jgi:hypothetical protein